MFIVCLTQGVWNRREIQLTRPATIWLYIGERVEFTYPGSVYTVYKQMPLPVFFLCTVWHYMIYTYNTDSLLSLISVLIAKTTDYTPCYTYMLCRRVLHLYKKYSELVIVNAVIVHQTNISYTNGVLSAKHV